MENTSSKKRIADRYELIQPTRLGYQAPQTESWVAQDTVLSRQLRAIVIDSTHANRAQIVDGARRSSLFNDPQSVSIISIEDNPTDTVIFTEFPLGVRLLDVLTAGAAEFSAEDSQQRAMSAKFVHSVISQLARIISNARHFGLRCLHLDANNLYLTDADQVIVDGLGITAPLYGANLERSPEELDRDEARGLVVFLAAMLLGRNFPEDPAEHDSIVYQAREIAIANDFSQQIIDILDAEINWRGPRSAGDFMRILAPWDDRAISQFLKHLRRSHSSASLQVPLSAQEGATPEFTLTNAVPLSKPKRGQAVMQDSADYLREATAADSAHLDSVHTDAIQRDIDGGSGFADATVDAASDHLHHQLSDSANSDLIETSDIAATSADSASDDVSISGMAFATAQTTKDIPTATAALSSTLAWPKVQNRDSASHQENENSIAPEMPSATADTQNENDADFSESSFTQNSPSSAKQSDANVVSADDFSAQEQIDAKTNQVSSAPETKSTETEHSAVKLAAGASTAVVSDTEKPTAAQSTTSHFTRKLKRARKTKDVASPASATAHVPHNSENSTSNDRAKAQKSSISVSTIVLLLFLALITLSLIFGFWRVMQPLDSADYGVTQQKTQPQNTESDFQPEEKKPPAPVPELAVPAVIESVDLISSAPNLLDPSSKDVANLKQGLPALYDNSDSTWTTWWFARPEVYDRGKLGLVVTLQDETEISEISDRKSVV